MPTFTEIFAKKDIESFIENGLDLDTNTPHLKDTPERVAKAYRELCKGLYEEPPKVTVFPNTDDIHDIVMSDCIPFTSVCSHHLLPFWGKCWVLYIPEQFIVGFSKFARIVEHLAARPTVQEKLVNEVADFIMENAQPRGVMVFSRAKHACAMFRGAKSGESNGLTTSTVRGVFKENSTLESRGLEMIKISLGMEGM